MPKPQPLELSTRVKYEQRMYDANMDHISRYGEGVIISSSWDSENVGPWWRYDVSAENKPQLLDHYPFEIYTDITEVDSYEIKQVFDEATQQWQYYF